jgi:ParB-like chromosome segregation protein Spo0J
MVEAEVVRLELSALKFGPSPRQRRLDRSHVAALAELEGRWPPILVERQGGRIIDGHHRVAAARMLGWSQLPVVLFDGTEDDAFVEAIRRNVEHGLPLTINERKAAARRLLGDHGEWSDRRIAQVCALTAPTVGRLRTASRAAEVECRIGRDGRGRPVRPESNRLRILEAVRANPEASLRTIAQAVGTSPETVRRVRNGMTQHGQKPHRVEIGGPTSATVIGLAIRELGVVAPGSHSAADPAVTSTADGKKFANWFDRTNIGSQWRSHVVAVPLSRVYEVADEARQRARAWSEFAELVEQRAQTSRAG